jgi:hypothetical protein
MVAAFATAFVGSGSATSGVQTGRLTATVPGHAIAIAHGDGSGKRVLISGAASFVSPDGARVAVTDYDQGAVGPTNWRVELYSAAGGTPTRVLKINCREIYWSPDSTRFACAEFDLREKPSRLLVINASSGAATTLGKGFFDPQVSFSPDSKRLAYVQWTKTFAPSGTLKLIDLATRATTTVRGGAAAPAWGSTAIAFSTVKPRANGYPVQQVAVIQPDGSGFRQLSNIRPSFLQGGLVPIAWSADGSRLLAGQGGQDTWQAYAVDPVRGGAREISSNVTPSALTPDGRFVIGDNTGGEDFGPDRANVVRVPWAGGKATVLLRNAVAPSYTANAKPVKLVPISGRCSKATASQLVSRLGLSLNDPSSDPVGKVVCGAFAGRESNTMVVVLAGPTGPLDWLVFRRTGDTWRLLMRQGAGASITAAGSDIRQTLWIYRPGDSRCCPSGGTKSRLWHWNGSRFVAGPWSEGTPASAPRAEKSGFFKTPSGNIVCQHLVGPSVAFGAVVACAIKSGLKPALPREACNIGSYASDRLILDARGPVSAPPCASDPSALVGESKARVLGYGKTWSGGGIRCTSAMNGLRCRNKSGRGFFLSRESWHRF